MEYYEVDLGKSRRTDYTKEDTVTIAVTCNSYPNPEDIERYLLETNSRFSKLKVCNIVEIDVMEDVIPFVEEIIDLDKKII